MICYICEEGIRIPAEAFRPILQRLIRERDEEATGDGPTGGLARLLRETDRPNERVHSRTLGGVLSGETSTIQFNVIDRILSRTGNFHLWYEEPLCKWFHEPRNVKPKTNRNRKHECKCGKVIDIRSSQCKACWLDEKRVYDLTCECGKLKSRKKAARCWECYLENRYGDGRKRYKATGKRFFVKHP